MGFTHQEIEAAVMEALRGLQDQLGEAAEITPDSSIDSLGLDSHAGIEFVCQIEDRLTITVPDEANPFVDDKKHRLRRVEEVIAYVKAIAE